MSKNFYLLFLLPFFQTFFSQSMKLPEDTYLYMEMNGKLLNQKIDWATLNPMIEEVAKDKKFRSSWNDFSKTGIKYDGKQQHFAQINDSVRAYTAHFVLDNPAKFLEFVNATKKEGMETSQKQNYSYVSLDKNTFVAWNNSHAVLKILHYSKPYDDDDYGIASDSVVAIVDSAAAVIIEAEPDSATFNYKEEIEYLKQDLEFYEQDLQNVQEEIKKIKDDIRYLEKYHRYPIQSEENKEKEEEDTAADTAAPKNYDSEEDEKYDDEDSEDPDDDFESDFKKSMDSINIAEYKINLKLAEDYFDRYFQSNLEIEVPKDKLDFRDSGSDLFAYTDYQNMLNSVRFPQSASDLQSWTGFVKNMYNTDLAYNLYFDKDKVRLVNSYRHKNPKIQESFSEAYRGTKNKKLTQLLSEKSIGFYALNMNTYKTFDLIYTLLDNSGDEKYQKEFSLFVETLKIALDEEAISKIAPGSGIFILNKLGSKKVTYTEYEYDDDYNEKEIEKTKDVVVPDFTFAFVTENEGYWKRLFQVLAGSKEFKEKIVKKGELYSVVQEENSALGKLFFTVKNGIVYLTTSQENIGEKPQTKTTKKWAKEIRNTSLSGKIDVKRLAEGFEKEITSEEDREFYNFFRKNAGELTYRTDVKSDRIDTEINYQTSESSKNSLMYFFDLLDEIYKMEFKARKTTVSF